MRHEHMIRPYCAYCNGCQNKRETFNPKYSPDYIWYIETFFVHLLQRFFYNKKTVTEILRESAWIVATQCLWFVFCFSEKLTKSKYLKKLNHCQVISFFIIFMKKSPKHYTCYTCYSSKHLDVMAFTILKSQLTMSVMLTYLCILVY